MQQGHGDDVNKSSIPHPAYSSTQACCSNSDALFRAKGSTARQQLQTKLRQSSEVQTSLANGCSPLAARLPTWCAATSKLSAVICCAQGKWPVNSSTFVHPKDHMSAASS
mmetsp:Transcript_56617/g.109304  ORF Transcript_56617/g.109304 Transcript_56617/m.109304 type:complete len:110 (-) Transcript_56617:1559-1888(-)